MKWSVTVKPNAKRVKVERAGPNGLIVFVNASPTDGRANKRLIELLAEHFGVAKNRIEILHGKNTRKKLVEISDSL